MTHKKPKPKVKAQPPAPAPAKVERDAVTRLAYELYVRRGCENGHDVEDWLMAEAILLERGPRSGTRGAGPKKTRRLEDKYSR